MKESMNNTIISFTNLKKMRKKNMPSTKEYKDIDIKRKFKIEKKVEDILKRNGCFKESTYPIDIVSLVKNDGFVIQTSEMDIQTTGLLIVNDNEYVMGTRTHRLIVVNKILTNENKDENYILKKSRFITAHEYGHFILHKKENEAIYAHRDSWNSDSPKEIEADYFARSILMPHKIFRTFYEVAQETCENDENMIQYLLATIFKTTMDKTRKRINDLAELPGELSD